MILLNLNLYWLILRSSTQSFDITEYISDIDNLIDNLNVTFLPEEDEGNIVGLSFYGGNILYHNDGFIFQYEVSDNPPEEDFILFKVTDGELESEPALITFNKSRWKTNRIKAYCQ